MAIFLEYVSPNFINLHSLGLDATHLFVQQPSAPITSNQKNPHHRVTVHACEPFRASNADAFNEAVDNLQECCRIDVRAGDKLVAPLRRSAPAPSALEPLNVTLSKKPMRPGTVGIAAWTVHASPVLSDAW